MLVVMLTFLHAAQTTRASFLGVGAPEAFVIGVVALLVFGPKGLAEVRVGKKPRLTATPVLAVAAPLTRPFT